MKETSRFPNQLLLVDKLWACALMKKIIKSIVYVNVKNLFLIVLQTALRSTGNLKKNGYNFDSPPEGRSTWLRTYKCV